MDAGLAGSECTGCLFFDNTFLSGPLVGKTAPYEANVAGCVDLVLGQINAERKLGGADSCGDLLTDRDWCVGLVCNDCVTSKSDYAACTTSALAHQCASTAAAIASPTGACAALDADASVAASECFPQSAADVPKLLNVFCGTGP